MPDGSRTNEPTREHCPLPLSPRTARAPPGGADRSRPAPPDPGETAPPCRTPTDPASSHLPDRPNRMIFWHQILRTLSSQHHLRPARLTQPKIFQGRQRPRGFLFHGTLIPHLTRVDIKNSQTLCARVAFRRPRPALTSPALLSHHPTHPPWERREQENARPCLSPLSQGEGMGVVGRGAGGEGRVGDLAPRISTSLKPASKRKASAPASRMSETGSSPSIVKERSGAQPRLRESVLSFNRSSFLSTFRNSWIQKRSFRLQAIVLPVHDQIPAPRDVFRFWGDPGSLKTG